MPRQLTASFLFCLLLLTGVPAMASDFFTDFPQHRYRVETVTYTPTGWPQSLQADLYLPLKHQSPPPVILLVHGGSWQHGKRSHMARIAKALAIQGYAAFSIDYRLAPAFRHPAQLQDMQQALQWLRQEGSRYGIDASCPGAWGFSAGAHLVSLLAVQPDTRLCAVVAGGTPADLRIYPDSPAVKALLGARPSEQPALYEAASPLAHVHTGLPPFFLYHGRADDLVIPAQAENFAQALKAAGVPVDVLWLPDYGHYRTALFMGKSLPAAQAFLARHIPLVQGVGNPQE